MKNVGGEVIAFTEYSPTVSLIRFTVSYCCG